MPVITIQATGRPPIQVDPLWSLTSSAKAGDKRRVTVTAIKTVSSVIVLLQYISDWDIEHDFTWVLGSEVLVESQLASHPIWDSVRAQAKQMLPPGAGYPATPAFETRQSKLIGMLETATLVALSDVLRQIQSR